MVEWSNEKVLKFLELYEAERLLWDCSHKDHKRKHKLHDAWKRISEGLDGTSIEELKSKKKSLMATFRPLLKKKKSSVRSGAGADEIFHPIWFAFDPMEHFLGNVYDVEDTINTEGELEQTDEVVLTEDTDENVENEGQGQQNDEENNGNSNTANDISGKPVSKKKRTRQVFDTAVAQEKLNDSFKTLNDFLQGNWKQGSSEDECDLYAKLLANKLRRYPENQRQQIMYKIDGFLLDHPPTTRSSTSFSSSSSFLHSPAHAPQHSPVHSHHSQSSPVYSHYSQPSPGNAHHSQPYSLYARHYQRSSTYVPSSRFSPSHIEPLQPPPQENPPTTPHSAHPFPAQSSEPSPLPESPTTSSIQGAFIDAITGSKFL